MGHQNNTQDSIPTLDSRGRRRTLATKISFSFTFQVLPIGTRQVFGIQVIIIDAIRDYYQSGHLTGQYT